MNTGSYPPTAVGTGLIALDFVVSVDPTRATYGWAGGTCGNVLCILSCLGWNTYPIARLKHDEASMVVRNDLRIWGVHLDYLHCEPRIDTPIVIQKNGIGSGGENFHKFSWTCPRCGNWLPEYRPVTRHIAATVNPVLASASVFFMDRLSRSALDMAKQAASNGMIVIFEPSARSSPKHFEEAIRLSHIIKYSRQRMEEAPGAMEQGSATLLEIQTLGAMGLQFRHRSNGVATGWIRMDAIHATKIVDTCGSGDWCTAGLLARTATKGLSAFTAHDTRTLWDGLRYGQMLAAWNCGFEGARGGMYAALAELPILDAESEYPHSVRDIRHNSTPYSSDPWCPSCTARNV